ncbi:MAG: glycoside hydrolase [Acidimicrobiales bacterium]
MAGILAILPIWAGPALGAGTRSAPAPTRARATTTDRDTAGTAATRKTAGSAADRDKVGFATGVVGSEGAQSIDGFGASGAWWPTDVSHFSIAAQRQLADLLFSRTGLELSQYRYNIGGGGVGVTNPYKAPPTVLTASGAYDWNADPAGMAFLKLAADYHVPELIGFVNSAPPAFTTNHKSCGGTLDPTQIDAFAAYLTAVVVHLHKADHIDLSYVSPMNEPVTSQARCHQEGMIVPVAERAPLVNDLAADLAAGSTHTQVIADESSLVRQLLAQIPGWLAQARSSVAVIAHHGYDYPDAATLEQVADLPLKHWTTEICCFNGRGFGWQYDPTMTNGLWLADTIWADLVEAQDSAFDWWVAASPNLGCDPDQVAGCQNQVNPGGRNDGLIYFDPYWKLDGNQTFYLTKRYWVMAAFSRYVRPGSVLHLVGGLPDGLKGVAFEARTGWVVELINDNADRAYSVHVQLPYPAGQAPHAYLTDAHHDLATTTLGGTNLDPVVQCPNQSLTTLVYGPAVARDLRTRTRPAQAGVSSRSRNRPST